MIAHSSIVDLVCLKAIKTETVKRGGSGFNKGPTYIICRQAGRFGYVLYVFVHLRRCPLAVAKLASTRLAI